MNKRILLSSMSIFASLALVTGATFAFFSDSGTSSGNVFGAGTMDIQLDDANETTPVDNITATFNVPSMVPGQSEAQEVSLHNAGSVNIAEIALGLTSTNTDAGLTSNLRDVLNMQVVAGGTKSVNTCTGGTDVTSAIDLAVGDNATPLTMQEFTGDTYDSLPIALAAAGPDDKVCVVVTMQSTASDAYQGDSATASFVFTAHQDLSQI